jgi:hypothetical protein
MAIQESDSKRLNPRQWATYRFIKDLSEMGKEATQFAIYLNYQKNLHDDGYVWEENPKHGDHCRLIWSDIKAINESPEVEKIIVIDKYTYRLGTDWECIEYYSYLKKKALLLMKRAYTIFGKMSKDGQGKLISDQDKMIGDNSAARPFVEAFMEKKQ